METGERIRRARERAGMSQEDLARAVGVSRTTASNWETGVTAAPRNKLGLVYEVLGLAPDGTPVKAGVVDADLRALDVSDLVALQGRLTAEFARRLGAAERAGPGRAPDDVVAFHHTEFPGGDERPSGSRRQG